MKEWLIGEERFAPDEAAVWAAVSAGTERRTVTRRRFVIGGVAAGVAAIVTGTTLARRSSDHPAVPAPTPKPTPLTSITPTVPTSTTAGPSTSRPPTPGAVANRSGTAAALARGHWRSLPAAPISALSAPVPVWTGTEMLVWGSPDDGVSTDGAAYDPHRRTWRKLPPAPVGSRPTWTGSWTGTSMILWGGSGLGGPDTRPTGARYTPGTDRWQLLPDPPIGISAGTQAVWTGSAMVALAIATGDEPERIDVASYNPVTDAWSPLPTVGLPAGHPVVQMKVAAINGSVLLLSQWEHTGSFSTAGTDCFVLDGGMWRPVTFSGGSGINGNQPLWAGSVLIQPAARDWQGFNAGPDPLVLTGRVLDVATGRVRDVAEGPVDHFAPESVWTGSALISIEPKGRGAAWNPVTNSWTSLPKTGLATDEPPVAVWNGSSLLMWGFIDHPAGANSSSGPQPAAGLELVASP